VSEFKCSRCKCRWSHAKQSFGDLYSLCWDCVDYLEAVEERRANGELVDDDDDEGDRG
jgi:hypothetical protein